MKKTLLLLSVLALSTLSAKAVVPTGEPLILPPLSTVLSSSPSSYDVTTSVPEFEKSPIGGGVYEATYTPSVPNYDSNMVPQNAAAKGEPVPEKREPRVRIQTKQRSQGNSYWNPGGKGTKSYF